LIKAALNCLEHLFIRGLEYHKAGVLLHGITPEASVQLDLFSERNNSRDRISLVVKEMEQRYGRDILKPLASAMEDRWAMKRELLSPAYTTCWEELPRVY
jgi:DNA polymerase V